MGVKRTLGEYSVRPRVTGQKEGPGNGAVFRNEAGLPLSTDSLGPQDPVTDGPTMWVRQLLAQVRDACAGPGRGGRTEGTRGSDHLCRRREHLPREAALWTWLS